MSIASVKIVAMVVREMGLTRRNVGMALIASAIIDDTAGWVIVAITSGLTVHGQVDALALGQSILWKCTFAAASFTLGRPREHALRFLLLDVDLKSLTDCGPAIAPIFYIYNNEERSTSNLIPWSIH